MELPIANVFILGLHVVFDRDIWMTISGAGPLSRKSFYFEELVQYTPSTTALIDRQLKTEQITMIFITFF